MKHIDSEHKRKILEHICTKCRYVSKTFSGMQRHESIFCIHCEICLPGKVDFDIHAEYHRACKLYNCVSSNAKTQ